MHRSENLHFSPSATIVDDLSTVPIDIQYLQAQVTFDIKYHRAHVESIMRFIVREQGNPIFDLRQDIIEAYLDNESLSIDKLKHHDFGGGEHAELIVAEKIVSPDIEHTLRVIYDLNQPKCPRSKPIIWDAPRLYYEFWFSDLNPARYLEMWFPSNLIYDQFGFDLEIRIINTEIDHLLFTNGEIKAADQNHWKIEFPESFTSLSHMLGIFPADRIKYHQDIVKSSEIDSEIRLDIFKLSDMNADLVWVADKLKTHISRNIKEIGPYIHGHKFTAFVWSAGGRSMEYEGAITVELCEEDIKHEVFHSWFARGIKPATQNDSWIDEAWTKYNTSNQYIIKPFDIADNPIILCPSKQFSRITPGNAYTDGSRFFATVARLLGHDKLNLLMASYYKDNIGTLATTRKLEDYLADNSGKREEILKYFRRFVYGLVDSK